MHDCAEDAASKREKELESLSGALRERATNAEREAYVLQGMVTGMQQVGYMQYMKSFCFHDSKLVYVSQG